MIIRIFPQMKLKASSLNNRRAGPPADRAEEGCKHAERVPQHPNRATPLELMPHVSILAEGT